MECSNASERYDIELPFQIRAILHRYDFRRTKIERQFCVALTGSL
jgi:hypothetical protein